MVQKKNRTQRIDQTKIISSLENIYISPLESCNLACKYCYTKKTNNILSNQQILDFVDRYNNFLIENFADTFFSSIQRATHIGRLEKNRVKEFSDNTKLKSIILCGGEVFLLSDFPKLINELIQKDIFVTIITNGTIDRLDEIHCPKNCQILISLDGPKEVHDKNRGTGNFEKSIKYIKHAQKIGFPIGIMFLVTKDSYPFKNSFSTYLSKILTLSSSNALNITYLTDRKMSLTKEQCLDIKLHYPTFPAKNFGCFQLSLQSNGNITGCCESNILLGKITDNPKTYINNFIKSLSPCIKCQKCDGCSDSSYLCGYPQELHQNSCQDIIKIFSQDKPTRPRSGGATLP